MNIVIEDTGDKLGETSFTDVGAVEIGWQD